MEWFKYYHGAVGDEKFMQISQKYPKIKMDTIVASFTALLSLASMSEKRGTIRWSQTYEIAALCGRPTGTIQRIFSEFVNLNIVELVDQKFYQIINWNKYQVLQRGAEYQDETKEERRRRQKRESKSRQKVRKSGQEVDNGRQEVDNGRQEVDNGRQEVDNGGQKNSTNRGDIRGVDLRKENLDPSSKEKRTKEKKIDLPKVDVENMVLPDCIPREEWSRWLKHLKEINVNIKGERAKTQIEKLEDFHKQGQIVSDTIDQSIDRGWQAFFPINKYDNLKNNKNGCTKETTNTGVRSTTGVHYIGDWDNQ